MHARQPQARVTDYAQVSETTLNVTGFESLCVMDASFLPFKRSLFSRASLELEREQLTADQLHKLSTHLNRFFHFLVPHFPGSAATRVLEYFIRKYKCAVSFIHCGFEYISSDLALSSGIE
jgi:hypothetical protein